MQRRNVLNRRSLLKSAAAAAAGLHSTRRSRASQDNDSMLIIDCHAHIYGENETKYHTIEEPLRPPAGTGTITHLKREMADAGVDFVTVIQTSTFYRFDNRFTADSARQHRDFMVGIVTLDPDDPRSPEMLERHVQDNNVRGMRSIPAKSGQLDDPGVDRIWSTAERLGVVINVLVDRDKRSEIEALVRRHPQLSVVIDHCLNLKAGPQLEPTLKDLLALATLPNVHAKLTFIPTGSAEPYPCRDMHDACRAIIAEFGANRCVWGSDFPCELWCPKITYSQHVKIFTHELGLHLAFKRIAANRPLFGTPEQCRARLARELNLTPSTTFDNDVKLKLTMLSNL